jgi:hypothetical protein
MNTFTRIATIAAGLLMFQAARADNPNIGTAGAQFLQIPVGARATAMGGAVVGHINDASSLFWNPAGIVGVPSGSLFAAYTSWWASVGLSHAAFVYSISDVGSFGVSVTMLGMDPMAITTELEPNGTGESFEARDLMVGLSYARRLTEDFSVGVTAKYVYQSIWHESASGIAFDIGTQYRIGIGDLTLAMAMTNFGGDMQMSGQDLDIQYDASGDVPNNRLSPARLESEQYPLPLHFQVGLSMTVIDLEDVGVLLAVDVTHPNDTRERVNLGTEVRLLQYLFLRGGYRINYDIESGTMGAGVRVPAGDLRVCFDYAYAIHDQLPDIHRISLGLDF